MKLGTVEINNPVKRELVAAADPARKKLIKHLEGADIENEKDFLRQLKLTEFVANHFVRKIDVGFLSKSKKIQHEGFVGVPVFGVFKYIERQFAPCVIRSGGAVGLNKVFAQALLKACKTKGTKEDASRSSDYWRLSHPGALLGMSRTAEEMYMRQVAAIQPLGLPSWLGAQAADYELSASFSGVLPAGTKRILKEAIPCFDEVDIIAEADWEIKKVRLEPFLVGVVKGDVYLLDHFDTSDLEKYVLSEFLI